MSFMYTNKPLALFISLASYYMHIMSQGNHRVKESHGGKKLANALKGAY